MSLTHLRGTDLNLLLVLQVLLEERNVTRAAARLGLSQSATSRALGRLRDQFGDALLVRTGAGMMPTPRALSLAEELSRILGELDEMLSGSDTFDPSTVERTFRIATVDYCIAVLIPGLLTHFGRLAPGMRVDVVPLDNQLDQRLESGDIDLLIAPRRRSFSGVVWRRLFTDRWVTMVRSEHPDVSERLSLARFAKLGHVVITPETRATTSPIDRALAKRGKQRTVALRVPSFLVAPMVVSQSDLITTAPERLAKRFADALPVRMLKTPVELAPLVISMAWHERVRRDAGHLWLRGIVGEVVAAL